MSTEVPGPPQEYSLAEKELVHEELNTLGAKLYIVHSWELLTLFLGNLDFFKERTDDGWHAVCQAGISRSDVMNKFMKMLEMPWSRNNEKNPASSGEGMSFWDMITRIIEGTIINSSLNLPGFSKSINNLIFFIRKNDLDEEQILRFLTNSLKQTKKDPNSDPKLVYFVVQDNEQTFNTVYQYIIDQLKTGKTYFDIAEVVSERFNTEKDQKKLNFTSPEQLFD